MSLKRNAGISLFIWRCVYHLESTIKIHVWHRLVKMMFHGFQKGEEVDDCCCWQWCWVDEEQQYPQEEWYWEGLIGHLVSCSSISTKATLCYHKTSPTIHWRLSSMHIVLEAHPYLRRISASNICHHTEEENTPFQVVIWTNNQPRATISMALCSSPWIPTPHYWSRAQGSQDRQAPCCCKSGNF